MKTPNTMIMLTAMFFLMAGNMHAQDKPLQNFRPYSRKGLNIFETPKDTIAFTGFRVRVGGGFTQSFQDLKHENVIDTAQFTGSQTGWHFVDANNDGKDDRQLFVLSNGFNLAMANLNIDAQLYDGIHLNLTAYLASRHHNEAWVKGGYVQIDKLTFLKSPAIDHLMQYFTIKIGDYEVNYGDQHYRRSDGGQTMYNPFVENLIMDEFTTEIGGEVQFKDKGIIAVLEMTGGEIKGDVAQQPVIDAIDSTFNKKSPTIIGKLGYDKQMNDALRIRITGSMYTTNSSASNTLFGGDRTGSRYFAVMENTASSYSTNAFSGRFNPGFSDEVTSFMINPFIKFHGLELFGTLEWANGRKVSEVDKRDASQYAVDVIYRFLKNENFWIGARYNTMTAQPSFFDPSGAKWLNSDGSVPDVTINRFVVSAGWFLIDYLMLKVEYVNQTYKDFPTFDIRNEGKFNGVMIEAAVGF